MKVIDSVYINDGGGYIMLQYFISQAKAQGLRFFYLIDIRLKSKMEYLGLQTQDYLILKNSEISRSRFYLRNQRKISSVLTFGNVPPPIRMKCVTYTIYHNILILNNNHLSFHRRMKYSLKNIYIRLLRKNTDFWIIQSIETQKELLSQNWDSPKKMIIAPFWKTSCVSHEESEKRQDLSFLYTCSPVEHKNLVRLLKAWESAFYKNHNIKLYLTLAESWFTDNKV